MTMTRRAKGLPLTIKNLDFLVFAASYDDIDKFHIFMKDFKSHNETFEKYADILCAKITPEKDSFDFFVHVPSSNPERTNFSLKLAELISKKLGKPLNNAAVKRIKQTKELKTLPREDRHKEIEDSFCAVLKGGERICIIDDVTASGATLGEIAKILKEAGASFINAAVVAVYIPHSL